MATLERQVEQQTPEGNIREAYGLSSNIPAGLGGNLAMDVVIPNHQGFQQHQNGGMLMDVVRPVHTINTGGLTMDVVRPSYTASGIRVSNTYNSGVYQSNTRLSNYNLGEGRVVAVNRGEGIVRETRQGRNSRVIGQVEVGSKVVAENYSENIIGERLNHLPERIVSEVPRVRASVKRALQTTEEECIFVEKIVEKQVEVIVEREVPKVVYVDVPYDQIVERPIERIIE